MGMRHSLGRPPRLATLAGLFLVVAHLGCNLTNVDVPGIDGPSELALSLKMDIRPDILVADGHSTAVLQVTVRGSNGEPVAGQEIAFAITDESGRFASIGTLSQDRAASAGNGVAQVVYTAPPRTDATANQTIQILARPVGSDFNGQIYRTVRLELRSAEPRLFPENPANVGPTCNYAIEAPDGFFAGRGILFQSTSHDNPDADGNVGTIVRYEWDFGDGVRDDKPDVVHIYRSPGVYTVIHVVTDDDGAQAACAGTLTLG